MFSEIGSDFWEYYELHKNTANKIPDWLRLGFDNRLLATGRTALEHIIFDIKTSRRFKSVSLPSYCCHTMIEPFVCNGIDVKFYEVLINSEGGLEYKVDPDIICDAVLVMNYFGYSDLEIEKLVFQFRNNIKNVVIIKDSTHSLFSKSAFNSGSDYVYASFRKWTAIPGGAVAVKKESSFCIDLPTKSHDLYNKLRIEGMYLKSEYISSNSIQKDAFLARFREAEELIESDYHNYAIDDLSFNILNTMDVGFLKNRRLRNAQVLLDYFTKTNEYQPLFSHITTNDCPLFVPIVLKKEKRDLLKTHLIKNNIYCPTHWPKSVLHHISKKSESIYETELSIVCDQRYEVEDMQRIITAIKNF